MNFLVAGLNHRHTPAELRGRFAFSMEQLAAPLAGLRERLSGVHEHPEVVLLSTCNRFELYCAGGASLRDAALTWLAGLAGISRRELLAHAYVFEDGDAARHAFRVASGLDSMVVGETQILGQMKKAVRDAHAAGCVGTMLNRLFQQTFSVAKKVRSTTGIGAQAVSVAAVAARLVEQAYQDHRNTRTLLVGAGEFIELVSAHLATRVPGAVAAIANRTFERAERLARPLNAKALRLESLAHHLHEFDTVVACTASPVPVIDALAAERALTARGRRPMLFVDLGMPRNIEPGVGCLSGATLRSLDDIAILAQGGNEKRREAASRAERIVDAAVSAFDDWLAQRHAVPLIRALHAQADGWQAAEIAQARKRMARGQDVESVLAALSRGLTRKMLHGVLTGLQTADEQQRPQLARTVSQLFLRCPVRNPGSTAARNLRAGGADATVLRFPVRTQHDGLQCFVPRVDAEASR